MSIEPFKRLRAGKDKLSASQYNRLVTQVEALANSLGQNVFVDGSGILIRRAIQPSVIGVRKAFCKEDAGEGNTIAAYLDTDETGQEVTVTCTIANGSDLNEAVPVLTDGLEIPVHRDIVEGEVVWKCYWPFEGSKDCVCVQE